MHRKLAPLGILLALVTTAALAADSRKPFPTPSPASTQTAKEAVPCPEATSSDGETVAEGCSGEKPDALAATEIADTRGATEEKTAAESDDVSATCKEYGQICRKTRQCCAPLHCAFDGYTFYCRY